MTSPARKPWASLKLAASLATVVVLPTPVGPDQGDDPPRAGDRRDRRGDRDARLDRVAEGGADRLGPVELVGLEALGDVPDQPAGQDLGHVGLEQLGVGRHQRAGQVGQQVVDPAVPAQVLDHRVQPAELLAELRVQGRSTAGAGDPVDRPAAGS